MAEEEDSWVFLGRRFFLIYFYFYFLFFGKGRGRGLVY